MKMAEEIECLKRSNRYLTSENLRLKNQVKDLEEALLQANKAGLAEEAAAAARGRLQKLESIPRRDQEETEDVLETWEGCRGKGSKGKKGAATSASNTKILAPTA